MSSVYFNDVAGFPSTGNQVQNQRTIICNAPKAADQLTNVTRRDQAIVGPGASGEYALFRNRFLVPIFPSVTVLNTPIGPTGNIFFNPA